MSGAPHGATAALVLTDGTVFWGRGIGAAETRLVEVRSDREIVRARALMIAEQIDHVLGLSMEDSSC